MPSLAPLFVVLFVASFLGIRAQTRTLYPNVYWEVGLAYALFFLFNLAVFFAAIHIPQAVYLLFLPALWLLGKGTRSHPEHSETGWILVTSLVFGLWTWVTPIADNDSLAYHIPMADNAILNHSLGAYPTLNLRCLFRWWGFEAQLGNLIILSNGSVAIVETAAWVSLVALFLQVRQILTQLNLNHTVLPALIACSAQSVFLVVTTAKNDVAFCVLALGALGLWLDSKQDKSITFTWLIPLTLYSALILSKSHYAVVFIAIVLAAQLGKPSKEKFLYCIRQAAIALVCLSVIVATHHQRFCDAIRFSLVQPPATTQVVCALTGLAPFEAGQSKGESPEIKSWADVFLSKRFLANTVRPGTAYMDPSHILLVFVLPALFLFLFPPFRPVLITLLGVGVLTVLFIRYPAYHSIRYLQPAYVPLCALGISLILSIRFGPRWKWVPLAVVGSFAAINAYGFLKSPALLAGVNTFMQLGRPGTPAEVGKTFNKYGLVNRPPALTGKVLSIPSHLRNSSAVYLLTDSSHAEILEVHFQTLETRAALLGLLSLTNPDHVVVSYGVGTPRRNPTALGFDPSLQEEVNNFHNQLHQTIQTFQDPISLWFAALGWEETVIVPHTVILYSKSQPPKIRK
jgi:hypothetical protein